MRQGPRLPTAGTGTDTTAIPVIRTVMAKRMTMITGTPLAAAFEGGLLALAAGMVPCPGAVLIMLYAVANDMIYPGFLLVAAMSLGIGSSICGLGVGAILARQIAMQLVERSGGSRGAAALRNTLNYAGATFVTLVGLVSFVAFLDVPLG